MDLLKSHRSSNNLNVASEYSEQGFSKYKWFLNIL